MASRRATGLLIRRADLRAQASPVGAHVLLLGVLCAARIAARQLLFHRLSMLLFSTSSLPHALIQRRRKRRRLRCHLGSVCGSVDQSIVRKTFR